MLTERGMYNAARCLAVALMIGSAVIGAAINMADLELSRHSIAVLSLLLVGITAAVGFLPRVQGGTPPGRRASDAGASAPLARPLTADERATLTAPDGPQQLACPTCGASWLRQAG